mmetsp:Transcript_107836/g.161321  ORF Transcript_107836/g.161321 Transcript_107836/m.161321 type:complete len:297 (-) Transcript_107836:502-1392(-)
MRLTKSVNSPRVIHPRLSMSMSCMTCTADSASYLGRSRFSFVWNSLMLMMPVWRESKRPQIVSASSSPSSLRVRSRAITFMNDSIVTTPSPSVSMIWNSVSTVLSSSATVPVAIRRFLNSMRERVPVLETSASSNRSCHCLTTSWLSTLNPLDEASCLGLKKGLRGLSRLLPRERVFMVRARLEGLSVEMRSSSCERRLFGWKLRAAMSMLCRTCRERNESVSWRLISTDATTRAVASSSLTAFWISSLSILMPSMSEARVRSAPKSLRVRLARALARTSLISSADFMYSMLHATV